MLFISAIPSLHNNSTGQKKLARELFKGKNIQFLMPLTVIVGNEKHINKKLLLHAAANVPSLVIDCANCANPHSIFPEVSIEDMSQIYVIELELLYKFRDVLLRVPSIARQIDAKIIVITISDFLFHYQDELENRNITEHCWELMHAIGKKYDIIAGLDINSKQRDYAKRFANKVVYQ